MRVWPAGRAGRRILARPEAVDYSRAKFPGTFEALEGVLVLPWNLREEISQQLDYVRAWGGQLVFPIPALEIV